MNLHSLNTICFTLSILCLILSSMLAISMIWMEHSSEFLMKSWSTLGVVFLASSLTLIVSKTFGAKESLAT